MEALPSDLMQEVEELRTAVHDCLCRAGRALSSTQIVERLKSIYRLDAEGIVENEALSGAGVFSFDALLQHALMARHVRHEPVHRYVGVPTEATRDAFDAREKEERRKIWAAKWLTPSRPPQARGMLPSTSIAAISRRGRGAAVAVKSVSVEKNLKESSKEMSFVGPPPPGPLARKRQQERLAQFGLSSASVLKMNPAGVTPAPTVSPPSPTADEDPAWLKFKAAKSVKPPLRPQHTVPNPHVAKAVEPIQSPQGPDSAGVDRSGVGRPRPVLNMKAKNMRRAIEATLRDHYRQALQLRVLCQRMEVRAPEARAYFNGLKSEVLKFIEENCDDTVDIVTFGEETYVALR